MADESLLIGPYQQTDYSYGSTQIDDMGLPKPQFIASNESGTGYTTYFADNVPEYLQPKESSLFGSLADTFPGWLSSVSEFLTPIKDSVLGSAETAYSWCWDVGDAVHDNIWPEENKYSDVLAEAFKDCPKASVYKGWNDSLSLFSDWVFGAGDADRVFGQCTQQVQNMADANKVNEARDWLYEKNAGLPFHLWKEVTEYKGTFGIPGAIRAGKDPTEQFVGSYKVEIFPQKNQSLRFEVTNNTSMESFLETIGPEYERSEFSYGGNMRQLYTWEEPLKGSLKQ